MSLALPAEPSDARPLFRTGPVSDWMLTALGNQHPPERKVWDAQASLNGSGLFRLRVVDVDDIPLVRRGLQGLVGVTDSSIQSGSTVGVGSPFSHALQKAASANAKAQRSIASAAVSSSIMSAEGQGPSASAEPSHMSMPDLPLSQPVSPQPSVEEPFDRPQKKRAERYYEALLKAEEQIQRGWEEAALAEDRSHAVTQAHKAREAQRRAEEPQKRQHSWKRRPSIGESEVSTNSLLLPKGDSAEEEGHEVLPYDGKLRVEIEVVVLPEDPNSRSTGSPDDSEPSSSPHSGLGAVAQAASEASHGQSAPGHHSASNSASPSRRRSSKLQARSSRSRKEGRPRDASRTDVSSELLALKAEMDLLQEDSRREVNGVDNSDSDSSSVVHIARKHLVRTRNIKDDAIWSRRNLGLGGTAFYVPDVERYALAHSLPPPPPKSLLGLHKQHLKPRLPLDISKNRYRDEAPSIELKQPATVVLTEERAAALAKTMRIADFYNAFSRSMTALELMALPGGTRRRPKVMQAEGPPPGSRQQIAQASSSSRQVTPHMPGSADSGQSRQDSQQSSRPTALGQSGSFVAYSTGFGGPPRSAASEAVASERAVSSAGQESLRQVFEKAKLPVLPQYGRKTVQRLRKAVSHTKDELQGSSTSLSQDSREEVQQVAPPQFEDLFAEAMSKRANVEDADPRFPALVDYESRSSLAWRTYRKQEVRQQTLAMAYRHRGKALPIDKADVEEDVIAEEEDDELEVLGRL